MRQAVEQRGSGASAGELAIIRPVDFTEEWVKVYMNDLLDSEEGPDRLERFGKECRDLAQRYIREVRGQESKILCDMPEWVRKSFTPQQWKEAIRDYERDITNLARAIRAAGPLMQMGRELAAKLNPSVAAAASDEWTAGCAAPAKPRPQPKRGGKKKGRGRGSRGSGKKRVAQPSSGAAGAAAAAAAPPAKSEAELRAAYASSLWGTRTKYTEAPRVYRWLTREMSRIRDFRDTKDERVIYRYQHYEDNSPELKEKRRYHVAGYCLDRVFSSGNDREIYTFPTQTGVGLLAQVCIGDEVKNGYIYYGIDDEHIIFHRFFEEMQPGDKIETLLQQDKKKTEDSGEEVEVTGLETAFAVHENGVIEVTYSGEDFRLFIHPVRPDLVKSRLESFQR